MKVYPRTIEIRSANKSYQFSLKNNHDDDQILLFKIRRAEQKVVDYFPKLGLVEPGFTQKVSVKIINSGFERTRLLVKLLSVSKNDITESDFERCWKKAEASHTEVKKVVEVVNRVPFDLELRATTADTDANLLDQLKFNIKRNHFADIASNALELTYRPSHIASDSRTENTRMSADTRSEVSNLDFDSHSVSSFGPDKSFSRDYTTAKYAASKAQDKSMLEMATQISSIFEPTTNEALKQLYQHQISETLGYDVDLKSLAAGVRLAKATAAGRANFSADPFGTVLVSILAGAARATVERSDKADPQQQHHTPIDVDQVFDLQQEAAEEAKAVEDNRSYADVEQILTDQLRGDYDLCSRVVPLKRHVDGLDWRYDPSEKTYLSDARVNTSYSYSSDNNSRSRLNRSHADLSILHDKHHVPQSVRALDGVLLEFFGEVVNDESAKAIVERLVVDCNGSRRKVAAMDFTGVRITSLAVSISSLFIDKRELQQRSGGASDKVHDVGDSVSERLNEMRRLYLEEHLKHLCVQHSTLQVLDVTVNRFQRLTSLALNDNCITRITGPINLPQLESLDLANNRLVTLDFLQLLVSLRTLNCAGNRIHSLPLSVNMLVPLAKSLTSLNLSGNPICQDLRYADTVLQALPRVRTFDLYDLEDLQHRYKASQRRVTTQNKNLPELPAETLHRRSEELLTTLGSRPRPDAAGTVQPREFEQKLRRVLSNRKFDSSDRFGSDCDDAQHDAGVDQRTESGVSRRLDQTTISAKLPTPAKRNNRYADSTRSINRETFGRPIAASLGTPYSSIDRSISPQRATSTPSTSKQSTRSHTPTTGASSLRPTSFDRAFQQQLPAFATQTAASKGRRKSQAAGLIPHWSAQHSGSKAPTPTTDARSSSSLLNPTGASKSRRKSFGIAGSDDVAAQHDIGSNRSVSPLNNTFNSRTSFGGKHACASDGYYSEGTSTTTKRRRQSFRNSVRPFLDSVAHSLTSSNLKDMQVDERYSIWHPRYRIPKPIFGYSEPFCKRSRVQPTAPHPPLFDSTIQRIRDGFEKLPTRGTFTRASKGLTAEWYPMDYTDLEAIRRQGFFHETIGDVHEYSHRDSRSHVGSKICTGLVASINSRNSRAGSVMLSPTRAGRRASIGQHRSRQYLSADGRLESRNMHHPHVLTSQPRDDFSGFRKWHKEHYDELVGAGLLDETSNIQSLLSLAHDESFHAASFHQPEEQDDPTTHHSDHALAPAPTSQQTSSPRGKSAVSFKQLDEIENQISSLSKIFGGTFGGDDADGPFLVDDEAVNQQSAHSPPNHGNNDDDVVEAQNPTQEFASSDVGHTQDGVFPFADQSQRLTHKRNGQQAVAQSFDEQEESRLEDYLNWLDNQQSMDDHHSI